MTARTGQRVQRNNTGEICDAHVADAARNQNLLEPSEYDSIDMPRFQALGCAKMNAQTLTGYIVAIGMISTVTFLYYFGFNIASLGGAIFSIWLFLPYMVWAYVSERHPDSFSKHFRLYIVFAIAMPLIGFGMVSYVVLHPDPQAGFFFLYIPFLQFICLWVAWMVC